MTWPTEKCTNRTSEAEPALVARAGDVLDQVCDPELPFLTIRDLGILRGVRLAGDTVEVVITPTYSGCPANDFIAITTSDVPTAISIDSPPSSSRSRPTKYPMVGDRSRYRSVTPRSMVMFAVA